jgi:cell division ATPase FtsA
VRIFKINAEEIKISHGKTRIKKLHEEHKEIKIRTTKEKTWNHEISTDKHRIKK